MSTTDRVSIVAGQTSALGYRRLVAGPPEARVVRSELLSGAGQDSPGEPLLTIGQLSDLHLCDSQSPVRAEFLDRWCDDDAPTKAALGFLGTYRAQELLTVQVAAAAVQALNELPAGPVGGAGLDWTITTGDVTDNAQSNELNWYIGVLDGGRVVPDSGSADLYEGVADNVHFDEAFWHPEPGPGLVDRPHRLHGFPDVPGLLDAARAPLEAPGLAMPWLAVHGNHDQMIQGTIPAVGPLATADSDTHKAIGLPAHWSTEAIVDFCRDFDDCRPRALELWRHLLSRTITVDPSRRPITRAEFIAAHSHASAKPNGHGFAGTGDEAYYRYDHGQLSVLTLDTVNPHGGWQGSLDQAQFQWLADELAAADAERRYVVLASHHPLATLVNTALPPVLGDDPAHRRVEQRELTELLQRHRCLILWLNGHLHRATVIDHHSWWELTAPSLIDFPQQGRVVEVLRSPSGVLSIAATMLDHSGQLPWAGGVGSVTELAGLSRELAANDWQRRCSDLSQQPWVGTPAERNVLLQLDDPFR